MKSQTDKKPTGPFSRKQLLAFLEKKAKEEKDWENVASYVKKVPGMRALTYLGVCFLSKNTSLTGASLIYKDT